MTFADSQAELKKGYFLCQTKKVNPVTLLSALEYQVEWIVFNATFCFSPAAVLSYLKKFVFFVPLSTGIVLYKLLRPDDLFSFV